MRDEDDERDVDLASDGQCLACLAVGDDPAVLAAEHRWRLKKTIARAGWAVQHVLAGDEPGEHAFSYTVGLHRLRLPELVVFGHGAACAQEHLNALARRLWSGHSFDDGEVLHDLPGGPAVMLVRAVETSHHLLWAHALAGNRRRIDAFQLVFPDEEDRWPWEPGFSVPDLPLLGVPRVAVTGPDS